VQAVTVLKGHTVAKTNWPRKTHPQSAQNKRLEKWTD